MRCGCAIAQSHAALWAVRAAHPVRRMRGACAAWQAPRRTPCSRRRIVGRMCMTRGAARWIGPSRCCAAARVLRSAANDCRRARTADSRALHTHTRTHVHARTQVYTHTLTHTHLHACTYMHARTRVHTPHTHTCTHACSHSRALAHTSNHTATRAHSCGSCAFFSIESFQAAPHSVLTCASGLRCWHVAGTLPCPVRGTTGTYENFRRCGWERLRLVGWSAELSACADRAARPRDRLRGPAAGRCALKRGEAWSTSECHEYCYETS